MDPTTLNDGEFDYTLVRPSRQYDNGVADVAVYDRVPPTPGIQYTPDLAFTLGQTSTPSMIVLRDSYEVAPAPAHGSTAGNDLAGDGASVGGTSGGGSSGPDSSQPSNSGGTGIVLVGAALLILFFFSRP